MRTRRRVVSVMMVLALTPFLFSGALDGRGQDAPKASVEQPMAKAPSPETAPAPRPPRERMAVYSLLAWIWLSIAVLFWLLRLRVREADRVFRMGLTEKAAKKPEDAGA